MKFQNIIIRIILIYLYSLCFSANAVSFWGSSLKLPQRSSRSATEPVAFRQCKGQRASDSGVSNSVMKKWLGETGYQKLKKQSLSSLEQAEAARASRLLYLAAEINYNDYKSAFIENSYLASCALERKITSDIKSSGKRLNKKNKKQKREFLNLHRSRYESLRKKLNLPYCNSKWRVQYTQLRRRIVPVLRDMRASMALMNSRWTDVLNKKNRRAIKENLKRGKLPLVCGVDNISVTKNIEHARGLGFRETYINISDYFSAPSIHNSYLGTVPEITPLSDREITRIERKIKEDAAEFNQFVQLDALRLQRQKALEDKNKPNYLAPQMSPSLSPLLTKTWKYLNKDVSVCRKFKKALHTFYEARYFMAIESFPILGYINRPHFDKGSKKWMASNEQMFDGLYDLRNRAFERWEEIMLEKPKFFKLNTVKVRHSQRGKLKLQVPPSVKKVKSLQLKKSVWVNYKDWFEEDWDERKKSVGAILEKKPQLCGEAERLADHIAPPKGWLRKKAEDLWTFVPGLACSYAREEMSLESGATCGLALLSKSTVQFVYRMRKLSKQGRSAIYRPVLKDPLFQRSLAQISDRVNSNVSRGVGLALWGWSAVSPETSPSQFLNLSGGRASRELFNNSQGALPKWVGKSVFNTILSKERRRGAKGVCGRRQVSKAVRFTAEYPEVNSYANYLKSADPKHGIPTDERFLLRGWFCAPVISRMR